MNFIFDEMSTTITPQTILDKDQLEKNILHAIEKTGSVERLWPHVKTHKSIDVAKMMIACGITKFKCATIAECEMVALAGAEKALLAYPLVGVNIDRFIALCKTYPKTEFHAASDDYNQIKDLDQKSENAKTITNLMIDVNTGMNRTGVQLDSLIDFYNKIKSFKNVKLTGLHCYDGDRHESDYDERCSKAAVTYERVKQIMKTVDLKYLIMGGSPSYNCYIKYEDVYVSPGTIFLNDWGYSENFKDLDFRPAAAILTRVISLPAPGYFTLDLGYKGIAADPAGQRGVILGMEDYEPVLQNEEHWVWKVPEGKPCPEVGTELFVIPTHICPTSALYPFFVTISNGKKIGEWPVTARNRIINL